MAMLLADEHFPIQVVNELRSLYHDVLTVRQISIQKTGDGISDEAVLREAKRTKRTVLTQNIKDYKALHGCNVVGGHYGIIACSFHEKEPPKLVAKRLDQLIRDSGNMKAKWIRLCASANRS